MTNWRPSPHGEGGLKSLCDAPHPTRPGPSPHGEGGLKFAGGGVHPLDVRPSPHGEGGLKFRCTVASGTMARSLPTRGGWIEIGESMNGNRVERVPPHTGRVD